MPAPDPDHAVVVDSLEMRYGSKTAVDGLSLTVARGSVTAVLGPNGAGKTTTLAILLLTFSTLRIVAVEDTSFGVKRGEIFGFLGTNGAGKTTTLAILLLTFSPCAS